MKTQPPLIEWLIGPAAARRTRRNWHLLVVLAGDLELVDHGNGGQVAEAGDVDDRDGFEGEHHLVRQAVLLSTN